MKLQQKIQKMKNKKGFTLIELIVVIAILGILAAVLIPSVTGYVNRANESAALANASNVKMAASLLYTDIEVGAVTGAKLPSTSMTIAVATAGAAPTITYAAADADSAAKALEAFKKIATNIPKEDTFTVVVAADGTISGTYTSGNGKIVYLKSMDFTDPDA